MLTTGRKSLHFIVAFVAGTFLYNRSCQGRVYLHSSFALNVPPPLEDAHLWPLKGEQSVLRHILTDSAYPLN